ncbi:MAG: hypothetical protein J5I94_27865 [Phaeodactylibacter sp.]|nr:hypothetical protein [Phaeodactylibacter sp.]
MRNAIMATLVSCLPLFLFGQRYSEYALNKGNALLFKLSYAGHKPGGDMEARFGNNFSFGGGAELITGKGNWILGADFAYIFGSQVKEDVLASLRTPEGFIIGNNRNYADIQLRERGFYVGALVGKLIGIGKANPRSGIRITLGAGLLQHKIRIQDDPSSGVPQLDENYKKGYDRLSNGLAFSQFIGYQILSLDKRVNFYAGLEFIQGFTMNRRDFNFDTRTKEDTERTDLLYGIRAGWVIPLFFGQEAGEVYY